MTVHIRNAKIYAWSWTLIWALGFAILTFISLWLSEGHLIYTLDDPYIHLAVAENILQGGYGVNLAEFSSPSSSILYPLLLTMTELLGLGLVGPLVINSVAAGLSVWLLLEFFWRYTVPEDISRRAVFPNVVAPFLILSISGFALPMTGMEHSLHVLAVLVTLRGLVVLSEGEPMPILLAPAIIIGPLLRFEGTALAAAAILALFLLKRWRSASVIGATIIACFCAYGIVMHQLGQPLLPSSVMVKSNVFTSGTSNSPFLNSILALLYNLKSSVMNRWGIFFILTICALIVAGALNRKVRRLPLSSPEIIISSTIAIALGAHLVAGRYGWFHRYEVYAVAIMIIGGLYLLRGTLQGVMKVRNFKIKLGVLVALAILTGPYLGATLLTPIASRGIYEQQFQMHRFVTGFFSRPVAVNDLGWVSYRNDNYVLDLWGLGSERVRKLRANGKLNAEEVSRLIEGAGVDYVMIYQSWLGKIVPKTWCLMAILRSERVTAAHGSVHFYATNSLAVAEMRTALDNFGPTLPKRVALERFSCPFSGNAE